MQVWWSEDMAMAAPTLCTNGLMMPFSHEVYEVKFARPYVMAGLVEMGIRRCYQLLMYK